MMPSPLPAALPNVLPPQLDNLLAMLRSVRRHDLVVVGWSGACNDNEHTWALWLEAAYQPMLQRRSGGPAFPGPVLELQLKMCTHCETVEVRDVSYDRLDGLPTGGRHPRRRDSLLGWYSGARRNNRVYT